MANQVVTFDSVDVSEYFATWQESNNARLNLVGVPRRHGALISDAIVEDARQITIEGRIQEATDEAARDTLDMLAELFARTNKRLALWDDLYINTYKASFGYTYSEGAGLTVIDFMITFFCADPFWYSIDQTAFNWVFEPNLTSAYTIVDVTHNLYSRQITVPNDETFVAYPIWTITAGGVTPLTHVTIRNLTTGRQFSYDGTIALNQSLIVDTNFFTVENNGVNDLTNWAGDFVWLVPGDNVIEIEGTAPAAYSASWAPRGY